MKPKTCWPSVFVFSFVIFLKCDLCFYSADPFMVCISYFFTIHNCISLQPPLQECSSTWTKSSWFCFNSYIPFYIWRNDLFWKFCCFSQSNTVLYMAKTCLIFNARKKLKLNKQTKTLSSSIMVSPWPQRLELAWV